MKRLTEVPQGFASGAFYEYPYSKKLVKKFTRKDRFGEEYILYEPDRGAEGINVPRNFAPLMGAEDMDMCLETAAGPRTYSWEDGFVARNTEQTRMINESLELLRQWGAQGGHIIQAPTGFGKTYIGASIIQDVGLRTCVITTKQDIMDQWKTALVDTLKIEPDLVGFWRGDMVPLPHHQVVVALVQSVCKGTRRYDEALYESFGMVMIDEVHRMGADKFSQAMWSFPAEFRVGLSATPYRKDGKEIVFEGHIGPVAISTEMQTIVPKVIQLDTKWKVPEVWQYDAEKGCSVHGPLKIPWGRASNSIKHLKNDKRRNSAIVNFLQSAIGKGRNTVVFSDTLEHLSLISVACVEAGMPEDYFGWYVGLEASVYGKVSLGDEPAKEQREAAKLSRICLATYKMCSEATDVPWWDTCVLASPKADVVQPVGRIRRDWEGKQHPLVLDMCDYEHEVLSTFANKRLRWYEEIDAEVIRM